MSFHIFDLLKFHLRSSWRMSTSRNYFQQMNFFSVVMFWHKDGDFEVPFNAKPRKRRYIELEYSNDFDENGIIYWIGSEGGSKSWTNPQQGGSVRVTMSSTESGNAMNITSRQTTQTYTRNQPNQTIEIDLGDEVLLTPNYYTIRHGFTSANYYPRNWNLEGSDDGRHWDVIKAHSNETAINTPQAAASFEIDENEIECDGLPQYSRFRVRNTGADHSGSNYLMVCGIELYGKLFTHSQHGSEFQRKKNRKARKARKARRRRRKERDFRNVYTVHFTIVW
eukprot:TRINITY_DN978_c0_g1_i1.p1 TRINITY_DN978_c0_g1~~TRINITY_DN978_c0_g1_i1.p1  ORF type:complete len:280 (-),score=37.67 TRINITY_DN978_c0_g1_i1:65-904(-)